MLLLLAAQPTALAAVRTARPRARRHAPPAPCIDAYTDAYIDAVQRATGHHAQLPASWASPCARPVRRTVTFRVPPNTIVGGFGDRLLGMVTVFYVALANGAAFGVVWETPYRLDAYFDLPCSMGPPAGAATVHAVDMWEHFETRAWQQSLGDVVYHTNARHWHGVVAAAAADASPDNLVRALRLHELDQATLFKLAIDVILGAPTPKLSRAAARALPQRGAPIVGVQIRVGGHQPKFLDAASRHTPESAACFGPEAHRLCEALGGCGAVFLTTDSRDAASMFKKSYARACRRRCARILDTPGDVLHTDRTNATDVAGFAPETLDALWTKSVLDWWLLFKRSDALVVSRSGFGETAGWASSAVGVRRLALQAAGVTRCRFGDLTSNLL